MEERARRFRLGLFVLGTGALFVALLAFVLQNSFKSARASYFILFHENVKGMVVGSKVNFQGVPIGAVADMRFEDGKTRVELRVDPTRASLQDLTRARMDRLLVTGQVTVELEGYGPGGKPLPPGSYIEPKEDPLHALTASLPEVVGQAAAVLARLDRVLGQAEQMLGDDNQRHVAAMLAHGERAAEELALRTAPAATALLTDTRTTLGEARATLGDVRGAAAATSTAVAALGRLEGDLRGLVREATALASGVRGPAQSALAGMRTTLEDLRGLLRQLKLAPESLLFGVRPAAPGGGER